MKIISQSAKPSQLFSQYEQRKTFLVELMRY